MKIGYLGPEGSHSERALELYDCGAKGIPLPDIYCVFQALSEGSTDFAFVPVQNSIAGDIQETKEELANFFGKYLSKAQIIDSISYTVENALGVHKDCEEVHAILSKDIIFAQCSDFLRKHYKNIIIRHAESTSSAMREILEKNMIYTATIGSKYSLEKHGLKIRAEKIDNRPDNNTTFFVLRRTYQ